MGDRHLHTNRLISQKSPYLIQHAHNPVDWYPWCEDAFQAARKQDKPIFLSIGYATCHWCHVMEKESFENIEVAKKMNETFINIKVDREELPEVDSLYMEFAQSMMAGAAGWPLNVILTPDLEPFFAATYLPPKASHGLTGLIDLVDRISEIWKGEEKEKVIDQAEKIVEVFSHHIHLKGESFPRQDEIEELAEALFKIADPVYGGIRGVPKFPIGYQWNFMLHYASISNDSRPLFLTERTLDMMHRGGIYDHLGGGFSRYSVDDRWQIPHFEKMLYDNAILAFSYLEAWQITKKPFYKQISKEIINYILRDMTHYEGGFYSAEDADSEGHEGYFYTWFYEEVINVLGVEESILFNLFYQITPEGSFDGRNILHTPQNLEDFAQKLGKNSTDLGLLFARQRELLWSVREKRVHPFKDDKILTSWNGLMIFSLIKGAAAFNEPSYLEAALKAARFLKKNLWQDGGLLRRWRENEALYSAGLDEYAFLIRGLLSLFEVKQGIEWLDWAITMTDLLEDQFKSKGGAFYQTDGRDKNIILRKTQFSDGAEPSGNAIHCENLLRLYHLTFNEKYLYQAEDILKAVQENIENYSPGYCYHIMNLLRYYDKGAATVVVALNEEKEHLIELSNLFFEGFNPHKSIIWKEVDDEKLKTLIPFLSDKEPINGKTTIYICRDGVCELPSNDFTDFKKFLS